MPARFEAKARYEILKPDIPQSFRRSFALDVLEGLSKNPKQIAPVYLYDKKVVNCSRKSLT